MKKHNIFMAVALVMCVLLWGLVACGCITTAGGTQTHGEKNPAGNSDNFINTTEDIENLVTDNDKLVINYYDAYIWTVFFDETGKIQDMIYIYEFETDEKAESMVKSRTDELKKNKTMTIKESYSVDNYVVIELYDKSFEAVTRDMLQNNFELLIVK